jgi:hypothetical protein
MRPSQLNLALKLAFKANRPLMIHGSPGIGKSDIVHAAAAEEGFEHVEDLRLSQLDQVDLRGVPSVIYIDEPNPAHTGAKDDTTPATIKVAITTWNPPEFLKLPPKSVLFLDEVNSAPPGVQAAAYQLVLNRRIGNLRLPDDCRIVLAGNLATDFALVQPMPSALKNRMGHVTLDVNNDDWCEWAIGSGKIHESILAFLRFRPGLLNEFTNQARTKESKAKARNMREAMGFATPRTWEMMSDYQHIGVSPEIEYELYSGIVGEGAAAEFTGFQKYYRALPNIDQVLMNPKTTDVPKEPATLYALSTALACRATPDNFERVMQYVNRIPKEFQVLTVRDSVLRDQKIGYAKAFTIWSSQNTDLIA